MIGTTTMITLFKIKRLQHSLSLHELASLSGIEYTLIRAWDSGALDFSQASAAKALRVANVFDVDVRELFGVKNIPTTVNLEDLNDDSLGRPPTNLKIIRILEGVSIQDLSHKSGVPAHTITEYETKRNINDAPIKTVFPLAKALNTGLESILEITQEECVLLSCLDYESIPTSPEKLLENANKIPDIKAIFEACPKGNCRVYHNPIRPNMYKVAAIRDELQLPFNVMRNLCSGFPLKDLQSIYAYRIIVLFNLECNCNELFIKKIFYEKQ